MDGTQFTYTLEAGYMNINDDIIDLPSATELSDEEIRCMRDWLNDAEYEKGSIFRKARFKLNSSSLGANCIIQLLKNNVQPFKPHVECTDTGKNNYTCDLEERTASVTLQPKK